MCSNDATNNNKEYCCTVHNYVHTPNVVVKSENKLNYKLKGIRIYLLKYNLSFGVG